MEQKKIRDNIVVEVSIVVKQAKCYETLKLAGATMDTSGPMDTDQMRAAIKDMVMEARQKAIEQLEVIIERDEKEAAEAEKAEK